MTVNLEETVEQAKTLNKIEDVIGEEPGFSVDGRGRYVHTREHDSLVIDTRVGYYYWNSNGEHGDVIEWLRKRRGWDFKSAVEFLCRRAGLPDPEWGAGSPMQRLAARAKQEVFDVAADAFSKWLWEDPGALSYARSRGWTDETIIRARLGYTGAYEYRGQLSKELHDAIALSGADPLSPAGVSVLGYEGDVRGWLVDHQVTSDPDWVEKKKIPGIIGKDMLVYPHAFGGRIQYLSLRGVHEKRHYNLPVSLVGDKQVYFNWEWSSQETQCVIVEGQADAITLAQWGFPGVALCGVHADEHLVRLLGGKDDKKRPDFYIGLDADKAGEINRNKVARLFGPMTRLIKWSGIGGVTSFLDAEGEEKEVKDANDLRRGMQL